MSLVGLAYGWQFTVVVTTLEDGDLSIRVYSLSLGLDFVHKLMHVMSIRLTLSNHAIDVMAIKNPNQCTIDVCNISACYNNNITLLTVSPAMK